MILILLTESYRSYTENSIFCYKWSKVREAKNFVSQTKSSISSDSIFSTQFFFRSKPTLEISEMKFWLQGWIFHLYT